MLLHNPLLLLDITIEIQRPLSTASDIPFRWIYKAMIASQLMNVLQTNLVNCEFSRWD